MLSSSSPKGTFTPRIRLYVEQDLAPGAQVTASAPQAHYLTHVMRAKTGEPVCLFNGRDGEWQARIAAPQKRALLLVAEEQLRLQDTQPDLWLAFAPVKRIEFLVEKATELGAAALLPVITRRTTMTRVNLARLRSHVIEAAEQSERLTLPDIHEPAPFAQVIAQWPPVRRLYFLDETGGGRPIAEVLGDGGRAGPSGFLTGPEGGFDQSELDALRQLPFATGVGLGPRVLRAETAALAGLACWQALVGDWRERRGLA